MLELLLFHIYMLETKIMDQHGPYTCEVCKKQFMEYQTLCDHRGTHAAPRVALVITETTVHEFLGWLSVELHVVHDLSIEPPHLAEAWKKFKASK